MPDGNQPSITYVDWLNPDGTVGSHAVCSEQQARDKSANDLACLVVFREMPGRPWQLVETVFAPEDLL